MSTTTTTSTSAVIPRSVQHLQPTHLESPRPGFSTRSLRLDYTEFMDPFVNLDNFYMDRAVFPPHPHAGFSAITYMFEDSEGSFLNQWSKSASRDVIGPGSLHWTQAGSGMMHEEVPTIYGKMCHGLQMFVKLPADRELSPPVAFHVDGEDVPVWTTEGKDVRVRVLVGSYQDKSASGVMVGNDGLVYLDVHLVDGATFTIPAAKDTTAFIFTIKGTVYCTTPASNAADGKEEVTTEIGPDTGAFFAHDGNAVVLRAAVQGKAQFLYCSGIPNREPLHSGGPFMMSTKERLADAMANYRNGAMGHINPLPPPPLTGNTGSKASKQQ